MLLLDVLVVHVVHVLIDFCLFFWISVSFFFLLILY